MTEKFWRSIILIELSSEAATTLNPPLSRAVKQMEEEREVENERERERSRKWEREREREIERKRERDRERKTGRE